MGGVRMRALGASRLRTRAVVLAAVLAVVAACPAAAAAETVTEVPPEVEQAARNDLPRWVGFLAADSHSDAPSSAWLAATARGA